MSLVGAPSGGGSGGSIAEDMYFADTAELDAFTASNSSRIYQGVACAVEDGLGAYDFFLWSESASDWIDANLIFQGKKGDKGLTGEKGDHVDSAIFSGADIVFSDTGGRSFPLVNAAFTLRGEQGEPAPNVQSEYSSSNSGPWVSQSTYDLNPDDYQFRRDSVDGGANYGDGYQFKSSSSELPAGWRWINDGNGGLQLQDTNSTTVWSVSPDGVTSSRFSILDSVLRFGSTKTMYDLGENVAFENSATGMTFAPVWQDTENDWFAYVRKPINELIRWNGDTFINADLSNTVTFELPLTATSNRRTTAFYVNSVAEFTDCTLLILQGGKTKVRMEGYHILAGEHRYEYKDSNDGTPFLDFLQGQSFTVKLINSSGSEITCYAQDGNSALPWFALDTTEFEDVTIIDSTSAGDGIQFDEINKVIALKAGSTTQIGGYKVGSGLAVDGDGRLYSTVSGSIVTSVADLVERAALPQIAQSYTCNVISENRIYYLNANQDPSVDSNWQLGPTTEASVTGFKGKGDIDARVGVVEANRGDYTNQEITYEDETTGIKRILVIDDGVVYAEEV